MNVHSMNRSFPFLVLVLIVISSLSICACARSAEHGAVLWKFDSVSMVSPGLNQYLKAARSADKEQDLFKRCLQFPDLPGTKWSQQHVIAHCNFHFGHLKSLRKIDQLIAKKDFAAIDALLSQAEAEHEKDANESIHTLVYTLSERNDILALTQAWLEANPKSVFAYTIQAETYLSASYKARGYDYAAETGEEQFRQMHRHLVDAKKSAEIALSISPESAITWVALASISIIENDHELDFRVMKRAFEKDEYCAEFARFIMVDLLPRWGGSYEAMQDYAEHLKSKIPLNPMLLLPIYAADMDVASLMRNDVESFNEKRKRLRKVIAHSSNEVAMLELAVSLSGACRSTSEGRGWEHGVLVLQHTRFHGISRDDAYSIFQQVASFDPQWAFQYGEMAGTKIDGKQHSDIDGILDGISYYKPMVDIYRITGATEAAEIFMLKARENISAELLMDSDEELMDLWLAADEKKYPNKAEKAKQYAEEMVKRNSGYFAWVAFNRYLAQFPNATVDEYLLESFRKNVYQSAPEEDFIEINKRLKY